MIRKGERTGRVQSEMDSFGVCCVVFFVFYFLFDFIFFFGYLHPNISSRLVACLLVVFRHARGAQMYVVRSRAKYVSCWQIFFHDWTICCCPVLFVDSVFTKLICQANGIELSCVYLLKVPVLPTPPTEVSYLIISAPTCQMSLCIVDHFSALPFQGGLCMCVESLFRLFRFLLPGLIRK